MKVKEFIDKLKYEKQYLDKGISLIGGVDEVGRGPLAGPVVTAAVIMPLDESKLIVGIDDSKKVSEKKRIVLDKLIRSSAVSFAICKIEPNVIDDINILNATKLCMSNTIKALDIKPQIVFSDALKFNSDVEIFPIIKGDYLSYTIGAASIIAKVYRDSLMEEYDKQYPEYGFAKHKGYGTQQHIEAIKKYGACPIHRKSFIKNFV